MYKVKSGLGTAPPGIYDCSGSISWYLNAHCWGQTPEQWAAQYSSQLSPIAPPQAPTGSVLTTPPASGEQAQQTVQDIINQQMIDQQAKNAAGVTSSTTDQILGAGGAAVSAAGDAASSVMSVPGWVWWALGGTAGFLVLTATAGRRR
jgi:hypothetical protein